MPIDEKPVASWDEDDLQELVSARRREGPRLEFKRELHLETDREKLDVEQDAFAMANAGGGVIVYGIAEEELDDSSTVASERCPLDDGSRYERLTAVLDSRGQPRLPFNVYAIQASRGGVYLVVEVSGRRRPHLTNRGVYYSRRGTQARPMTEAEIAEAYRERLLRELPSARLVAGEEDPNELLLPIQQRVHRGLWPGERAGWRESRGLEGEPGWLSVVVCPEALVPGFIDPIQDLQRVSRLEVPGLWDDGSVLPHMQRNLNADPDGLFSQLPPGADDPHSCLLALHRDGLMEYGQTLEPALLHEDPADNRQIFSLTDTYHVHDALLLFASVMELLGYDGLVRAQVSFDHVLDHKLGVDQGRWYPDLHPINRERIRGDVWRGTASELREAAGRLTKRIMDRVFLSAGIPNGCFVVDDAGHLVQQAA